MPRLSSAVALLGVLSWGGPLLAQGIWPGPATQWSVAVEVLHPIFRAQAFRPREAPVSGVVFATARHALGPSARIVVDLPVAHGSFGPGYSPLGDAPPASGTTVGSPYLGLEIGQRDRGVTSELGIRFPLVAAPKSPNDSAALAVGRFADLERSDAFTPGLGAISALVGYGFVGAGGLRLRVGGGPVGQFITSGVNAPPLALWLAYSGEVSFEAKWLDLRAGLAGRLMMTPGVTGASGTTGEQLLLRFRVHLARLRPGATLRIPLGGELRDAVGASLGLEMGVPLS